ncbi:uncharacterized protein LOC135371286 isoform X2 [Ornithodoros turicata]|uniref:uncharacterized protein LOC135371286 isoform X2 n=1 Tax=Ornithodoros turicata TaxID=34597 RepID=UPI003138B9BA
MDSDTAGGSLGGYDKKWLLSLVLYLIGVSVPTMLLPTILQDSEPSAVTHCAIAMMVMYATNVIPMQMTAILPVMFLSSASMGQNTIAPSYFSAPILQVLSAMIVVVSMESTTLYSRCAFQVVQMVGARARSLLFSLAGMSFMAALLFESLSGMLVLFSVCRSIVTVLKMDEVQRVQRKVLFQSATQNMPPRLRKNLQDYVLCEECALTEVDAVEMPCGMNEMMCDAQEMPCEVPGSKAPETVPVTPVEAVPEIQIPPVAVQTSSGQGEGRHDKPNEHSVTPLHNEALQQNEAPRQSGAPHHNEARQGDNDFVASRKRKVRDGRRNQKRDKHAEAAPSASSSPSSSQRSDAVRAKLDAAADGTPSKKRREGNKVKAEKRVGEIDPPPRKPSSAMSPREKAPAVPGLKPALVQTKSNVTGPVEVQWCVPPTETHSESKQERRAAKSERSTPSSPSSPVRSGCATPLEEVASLFTAAETMLPSSFESLGGRSKRKTCISFDISTAPSPTRKKRPPSRHCPEFLETYVKESEVLNSIVSWKPSTFKGSGIHRAKWLLLSVPTALSAMAAAVPCLDRQFLSNFDTKPGPEAEKEIRDIIADNVDIMGKIKGQEKIPLACFAIWLLRISTIWRLVTGESMLHLPIDFTIVVMLFLVPASANEVNEETATKIICKLPWGTIILAGGISGLKAGWREFVASYQAGEPQSTLMREFLRTCFAGSSPLLAQLFLICTSSIFTEFLSSFGTVSFLLPVVTDLARDIPCHPMYLEVPLTLAASTTLILPTSSIAMALLYDSDSIGLSQTVVPGLIIKATTAVVIALTTNLIGGFLFQWNHPIENNATTFENNTSLLDSTAPRHM